MRLLFMRSIKYYTNHPSIIKIRKNFNFTQLSDGFTFKKVPESDIYKRLKNIDGKKSTGIDKIPPKLVKKSTTIFSKPLCDAVYSSLLVGTFPHDAKAASVSPTDKGLGNKKT